MNRSKRLTLLGSALLGGTTLNPSAHAGGVFLYETATPDVGLASAGYASRVDDASTVFRNPAGMSYLSGVQFQAGAQLTYGSAQFSPDGNTSARPGTEDGENAIGALPAGGFYLVVPLSEKFAVGLGGLSYFGLIQKYDSNWVGRYYAQEDATLGMSLMPSVSFKANDWLSIGAGLNAMYGSLDAKMAVNNQNPSMGDGRMELNDQTWGFGANVGIMIEPLKGTRAGVTYLSPVHLDFKDTPEFSNLGPGLSALLGSPSQLNLGMEVPPSVMVSLSQRLNPQWNLLADFGWEN